MRSVILVALVLVSFGAPAQVVYKCVDARGAVVYQSHRCDPGQKAADAWSARQDTPDQLRRAELARRNNARQAQAMRGIRQRSAPAATVVQPAGSTSTCASTKAERDRYYDRHSRISLATMQYWEDRVSRACGY